VIVIGDKRPENLYRIAAAFGSITQAGLIGIAPPLIFTWLGSQAVEKLGWPNGFLVAAIVFGALCGLSGMFRFIYKSIRHSSSVCDRKESNTEESGKNIKK